MKFKKKMFKDILPKVERIFKDYVFTKWKYSWKNVTDVIKTDYQYIDYMYRNKQTLFDIIKHDWRFDYRNTWNKIDVYELDKEKLKKVHRNTFLDNMDLFMKDSVSLMREKKIFVPITIKREDDENITTFTFIVKNIWSYEVKSKSHWWYFIEYKNIELECENTLVDYNKKDFTTNWFFVEWDKLKIHLKSMKYNEIINSKLEWEFLFSNLEESEEISFEDLPF